jgi:hypothetical protein
VAWRGGVATQFTALREWVSGLEAGLEKGRWVRPAPPAGYRPPSVNHLPRWMAHCFGGIGIGPVSHAGGAAAPLSHQDGAATAVAADGAGVGSGSSVVSDSGPTAKRRRVAEDDAATPAEAVLPHAEASPSGSAPYAHGDARAPLLSSLLSLDQTAACRTLRRLTAYAQRVWDGLPVDGAGGAAGDASVPAPADDSASPAVAPAAAASLVAAAAVAGRGDGDDGEDAAVEGTLTGLAAAAVARSRASATSEEAAQLQRHWGACTLPACHAVWLWAVLARIESPLTPDMTAVVRSLYGVLARMRQALARPDSAAGGAAAGLDQERCERLAAWDVVMAVIGDAMGQGGGGSGGSAVAGGGGGSGAAARGRGKGRGKQTR